jgi:hypothetical protein
VLVGTNQETSTRVRQQLNGLIVNDYAVVPLDDRSFASGTSKGLTGSAPRTFDSESWNIADWKKG